MTQNPIAPPRFASAEQLRDWESLFQDAQINETYRRARVHRLLIKLGLVTPQQITRQLYPDVLNADSEDPYLALREIVRDPLPSAQ
ncbi:MAG: hypothetical protein RMI91_08190 [Gemmatales bacterium]|nr:hypothetical protein [Gemmatales bacterium]MDW7994621.1 hypothetical protein [Gemmatales bacterium]